MDPGRIKKNWVVKLHVCWENTTFLFLASLQNASMETVCANTTCTCVHHFTTPSIPIHSCHCFPSLVSLSLPSSRSSSLYSSPFSGSSASPLPFSESTAAGSEPLKCSMQRSWRGQQRYPGSVLNINITGLFY